MSIRPILEKKKSTQVLEGAGAIFFLVSGNPIQEPVAWHGPIVMHTNEEIQLAMSELNNGTFIKQ